MAGESCVLNTVTLTYSNLSSVAHEISFGEVLKGGKSAEGSCMDISFLQLPSHMYIIYFYLWYIVASVNCGGHTANSCLECGNNARWCNGDCYWSRGQCKKKGDIDYVNCGTHTALSCSECGRDRSWCNGDCYWSNGRCKMKGDAGDKNLEIEI